MALDGNELRSRASHVARHPRTRKIALWFVSIIIAIGILGALVAPPLLRSLLESRLSEQFHRPVSIRQIRINPYAMTATMRGFLMKERESSATAVSFDELRVNLQLQSLFRLAPVVKELRLVKPYVNLVRNEDRTYNYQDLMQPSAPGPSGPPPRFALHNIEIIDGEIDFDDRPEQTQHKVSAIRIGVPFLSSLPSQADIKVQPAFSALVNGAPLAIEGETKPFKDSQESIIHLNLDKLQIAKYLEYSPVELNFQVPSGEINGKLTASFRTEKGKPAVLTITGDAAVHDLAMQDKGEAPLIKLPALELAVEGYDVIGGKANLKSIKARGLEVDLRRSQDGQWNLARLVERQAPPTATPAATEKAPTPFVYHLGEVLVESGKLRFTDDASQRRYEMRLDNVRIDAKALTNEAGKKATVEISFESDNQERVTHIGELQLSPLLIDGKLEITGLRPGGFRTYYENTLAAEIRDGLLDVSTAYSLEQKEDRTDIKFSELNAALRSLRVELPGQPEPLWRIGSLAIKDATVDVNQKTILIGMLEGRNGSGFLQREPDGTLSYARLMKNQPSQASARPPAKSDDAAWKIQTQQIALDGFRLNFDDRAAATPARTSLSDLSLRAENFSNAKNQRAKVRIRTRINNKGALRLDGSAGANPVAAKFTVEARDVDLAPFQPYLANQVNFVLNGGRLGSKGELTVASEGSAPAKVAYDGTFEVLDFATVEKDGGQDLLKWKSLGLGAVHFAMAPLQLSISEINLQDFYSRLILGSDGKINLQKLRAQTAEPDAAAATAPAEPPPGAADTAPESEKQITIGKINLEGGNVQFSDFFVKPNYSANLTGVKGSISELRPEAAGDLVLEAKLDEAAPVDIAGKINPLSKDLFLDIEAHARDIELSPFSPYSGKYVGYGIEQGKLSFNVKYKLEERKLSAENQIILNQLTFGERIESPTATKLPVLLAVALLKDRNGVIDVNLPISGSLDDPQFSVGGIVLRLVINLITRAVTAPFTLLGSIFGGGGGGGEELSYIEFDYGRATLTAAAEAKIKTLATAMNNRPALKLQISGRADPANDWEGLKKVGLERKVKAQKLKQLARQGNAPKSVDEVRIEKDEYERFLKAAYGEESFPKPRNVIGLAKDLPAAEMESLMLKHAKVSDDDVRELATRRAQAVRERLLATGQITADRLSLVTPKPVSAEQTEKAKAKLSRVDFTLS